MDYESAGFLHQQFQQQAKRTPDNVAVVSPEEDRQATFSELDRWTDTLAIELQSKGTKRDTSVGIYLDKSIDFVIAYLATLKAGGGYLPIDTSYPPLLLDSVVKDASPNVIVTNGSLAGNIRDIKESQLVVLQPGWTEVMRKEQEEQGRKLAEPELTLDSLAYTVYSSGTTGKPKGIMCPQRGAVFSYHSRHSCFPYQPDDREACNVFFVWEMLRPLLKGIPMYVIPNHVIYDPPYLCDFLREQNITRMLFTPSLLETLLNTVEEDRIRVDLATLRQVWFCGEVLTVSLLERCISLLPWIRFVNLYSVSECHDVACEDLNDYYSHNKDLMRSRKFCPVGQLIEGVEIVILNDALETQPVGKSGEIYVAGPTLAIGYVNRPDVQRKRFVFLDGGKRLYRTGDWGYMLSDKRLEICGRIDTMVKIRGYSIEVQAVESCLLSLPVVKACVVIVCGDEGEDKFLVAYMVPDRETSKKEVRAELKKLLPFYMVPSYFIFINSIPCLASSGKLDKKALPAFDSQSDDIGVEGRPSSVTEIELAQIWISVLGLKEVDIQESFFDLGGHSLIASEILQKAKAKFKVSLAVRDLFQFPTIAGLAQLIESRLTDGRGEEATGQHKKVEPQGQPKLDLMAEVRRHDQGGFNLDMQLRAFWRTFSLGHHFGRGRVLLTGATGFLGAFILKELLLSTKLLVYCLVRELPHKTAMDRIKETLAKFGILTHNEATAIDEQAKVMDALEERVMPLKGNVSLLRLGLSEDDYTYLCTDVDFVIHAAATVNLAYPYSALNGPNVIGTSNVIHFTSSGKVKALHYISTDGVFPHGLTKCQEDTDIVQFWDQLADGYSQSKWVAEVLVLRARERGMPVTIYRPGNLSGDSKFAHWNSQDFNLLMLQACAATGMAPDIDWEVEMTPVDFAAKVIVQCTQQPQLVLGTTLHLVNDKPIEAREIFKWMNSHGYPLQQFPFDQWKQRIIEELPSTNEPGAPSSALMDRVLHDYVSGGNFLNNLSTYENSNLQRVLSVLDLVYPYTDQSLLATYFRELTRRRVFVRWRSKTTNQPLADLVAVVTGASRGIGQATAQSLAAAGAKVALAARQEESMMETVKTIKADGGHAIAVKTDVTSRQQVKSLIQETELAFGPVDILVNCAGVMYYTMMKNVHEDEWERQIDVNCKGVMNGIGATLQGMLARGKGHIINISSDAGRKGFPGLAVYSGTKFFVEGMSQALRQEIARSGVRVTCIQPGDVKTQLVSLTTDQEAKDLYDGSQSNKILEPTDIANAVVYAASQPEYVAVNEILIEPREAPA